MAFELQKLPMNIVKYVVVWCVILGLVMFIPNNKLGMKDAIILSTMLTTIIAIVESMTSLMSSSGTLEKFEDGEIIDSPQKDQQTTSIDSTQQSQSDSKQNIVVVATNDTSVTTDKVNTQQTDMPQTTQTTSGNVMGIIESKSATTTTQSVPTIAQLYADPKARDKEANGSRSEDDVVVNDMPYTDYHHIPLGDTYKPSDFEYGYSFLPPEKWYPTPPFPPVCVSEKRCPVCPTFTNGTPVDVKEWNASSKITPPAGINTKYIKDTLNAGR